VHARLIIEGNEMKAGASIGIATYPKDADSAQELIKCADSAMFKAKDSGRGQAKFFS
jgi:diguanylate cyclase (GGDEF)-like protein